MSSTHVLQALIGTLQVMDNSAKSFLSGIQDQEEQQKQPEVAGAPFKLDELIDDLPVPPLEDLPEQQDKGIPAGSSVNGTDSTHEVSLRNGSNQIVRRYMYSDADLKFIYSKLSVLVDKSINPDDCAIFASMRPELDKVVHLIKPVAIEDCGTAAYICSFFSNLSTAKDVRTQLNAPILWDLVLSIAEAYIIEPQILRHVLVCIANLAFLEGLHPTLEECRLLARLILPVYTEVPVFEAWAIMLCNITGLHPETAQMFVQAGVVEVMERLVLYHGEDGKAALRGVQSLANLAVGFTSGHFPVSL